MRSLERVTPSQPTISQATKTGAPPPNQSRSLRNRIHLGISGGNEKGLLAGLDETIARAGPKTQIIPGHGSIVGREALVAQRDMVIAVRDRVAALVSHGKSLDEVIAAKPTASFDAHVPQSAETAKQFIWWLYTEVKAARPMDGVTRTRTGIGRHQPRAPSP